MKRSEFFLTSPSQGIEGIVGISISNVKCVKEEFFYQHFPCLWLWYRSSVSSVIFFLTKLKSSEVLFPAFHFALPSPLAMTSFPPYFHWHAHFIVSVWNHFTHCFCFKSLWSNLCSNKLFTWTNLFSFYFHNIMVRTDLVTFKVASAIFRIAEEMHQVLAYFHNPVTFGGVHKELIEMSLFN